MTKLPAVCVHEGCVTEEMLGAAGGVGTGVTVMEAAPEIQPLRLFRVTTLYVPGATPVKVVPAWKLTPLIL